MLGALPLAWEATRLLHSLSSCAASTLSRSISKNSWSAYCVSGVF